MKTFLTLMHREWMQHRLGWLLLAFVPLGLALLLTAVGDIHIDDSEVQSAGAMLPALVALVTMMSSTAIVFAILTFTSLVLLSGLPRRDHADRSVEFWMSLPTPHWSSLSAPLLMHLLLVPAVALLVGAAGGWLISAVTVARVSGVGAWFDLPWGTMLPAILAVLMRLLAGLPMAALWLLPLVMLVMLSTALFKRWGIPLLGVVLGLSQLVLTQAYGITFLGELLAEIFTQAGQALVMSGQVNMRMDGPKSDLSALLAVPGWAWADFGHAVSRLASPVLLGGVVFSSLCFTLLVDWRRRSV